MQELRATPNIEYLGHVAPEKAEQVIAGAAVFLSTSDEEGFPNTFVQAWSSGTPVVSLKIDPDRIIERLGLGTVSENVERAIDRYYWPHRFTRAPRRDRHSCSKICCREL